MLSLTSLLLPSVCVDDDDVDDDDDDDESTDGRPREASNSENFAR